MPRTSNRRVYVATNTFVTETGTITAGITRVREGHPLLKTYPDWFRLADDLAVHYEVEAATAAPGELRGDQ